MKKHTPLKSKFNSAFSLVELLVVIAVIAIIAAIAIPNVSDIIGGAGDQAARRTAQTIANQSAAVRAAGDTEDRADLETWIGDLEAEGGIVVRNNYDEIVGEFKVDMPDDETSRAKVLEYLDIATSTGGLTFIQFNDAGTD
jgi:prepilin-type N-terminal cleavage/methylation domain-containing protein